MPFYYRTTHATKLLYAASLVGHMMVVDELILNDVNINGTKVDQAHCARALRHYGISQCLRQPAESLRAATYSTDDVNVSLRPVGCSTTLSTLIQAQLTANAQQASRNGGDAAQLVIITALP